MIDCSVCSMLVPFEKTFVTVFMRYTNKASSFMLSHIYLYNLWTFLTKNLCANIKITAVILCVRLRSEKSQLHNLEKRM